MFGTKLMKSTPKALAPVREITSQTKEASALLTRVFDQRSNGNGEYALRISEISELCNAVVRQTAEKLKHSFGSAFDREDIYSLVLGMSMVVHQLEMLATSVSEFGTRQCTAEMSALVDRIQLIIMELDQLIPMINRPKELQAQLRTVQVIQKESHDLHADAISKLFRAGMPLTDTIKCKDIYDGLDAILERCQYVVNVIGLISIKQG